MNLGFPRSRYRTKTKNNYSNDYWLFLLHVMIIFKRISYCGYFCTANAVCSFNIICLQTKSKHKHNSTWIKILFSWLWWCGSFMSFCFIGIKSYVVIRILYFKNSALQEFFERKFRFCDRRFWIQIISLTWKYKNCMKQIAKKNIE